MTLYGIRSLWFLEFATSLFSKLLGHKISETLKCMRKGFGFFIYLKLVWIMKYEKLFSTSLDFLLTVVHRIGFGKVIILFNPQTKDLNPNGNWPDINWKCLCSIAREAWKKKNKKQKRGALEHLAMDFDITAITEHGGMVEVSGST